MFPEIAHWGPIHIRSYGLMLAVAFLVGTWISLREARRLRLDEDKLVSVILVTLIVSVFGARLLYVLEHLEDYRRNWPSVLALWEGGLTLYGGIVAGAAAGLWMARRVGLPMWTVADALTPSVALGTAFGRVGCLLNGCCYGRPTTLPWGIVYPPDSFPGLEFGSTPIHPSQIYFSIAGVALFAVLWALRKRIATPGMLFWLFIVLFAAVRVPLDFTRAYEADSVLGRIGGLEFTESQLVSLTLALFGLLMMVRLRRQRLGPQAPAAPESKSAPERASSPASTA